MINATIEAIRTALHKEFGDAYAVISEGGMQDLKGPCFFISCRHTAFKQMAGRKYFRKNQYVIRHVPEPGHARTGCYAAAGMPLTGGTNGEVDGNAYQDYLDKAEAFRFHTMGVVTTDETTKRLFAAYVKRMRNEVGVKFQLVLYQFPSADDMGVISVKNKCVDGRTVTEEKTDDPKEASLVLKYSQ